jgi:hypothetical protein
VGEAVGEQQRRAVVELEPGDRVVPGLLGAERGVEPAAARVLGQSDDRDMADVAVRVDVRPPDLDVDP